MTTLESYQSKAHYGWKQQCENCSAISAYSSSSPQCEACGSTKFEVYFECPECGKKTEFGNSICSGCQKEISELISDQFKEPQIPETGKKNKHRILRSLIVFLIFIGLTIAAGMNIFVSIACGIAIGLLFFFF